MLLLLLLLLLLRRRSLRARLLRPLDLAGPERLLLDWAGWGWRAPRPPKEPFWAASAAFCFTDGWAWLARCAGGAGRSGRGVNGAGMMRSKRPGRGRLTGYAAVGCGAGLARLGRCDGAGMAWSRRPFDGRATWCVVGGWGRGPSCNRGE